MFSSYCVSKCHTTHFDHLRRLYFVPKEFVGEFGLPSSHRNDRWQHHPQHHHNQPTKPTKHQQQHQQKDQQQHQQQHQYQWQQQSIQQQQSRFSRNISSNISVATSVVTITLSSTLIVNEYICKVRFYPIQKKYLHPWGKDAHHSQALLSGHVHFGTEEQYKTVPKNKNKAQGGIPPQPPGSLRCYTYLYLLT